MPDIDTFHSDEEISSVDIYNAKFNYFQAVTQANLGRRIRRYAWNNTDTNYEDPFVFYVPNNKWDFSGLKLNNFIKGLPRGGFLAKYTKVNTILPYFPGSEDMKAKDWYVVNPDEDLFNE